MAEILSCASPSAETIRSLNVPVSLTAVVNVVVPIPTPLICADRFPL